MSYTAGFGLPQLVGTEKSVVLKFSGWVTRNWRTEVYADPSETQPLRIMLSLRFFAESAVEVI